MSARRSTKITAGFLALTLLLSGCASGGGVSGPQVTLPITINSNLIPRTRRIRGEIVFDEGKLQIIRVW